MTALRFQVEGEQEPLALEPTLNLLSDPDEPSARPAAEALAKVFKDNVRLFTLITNTLAKDKEISDRWRGFKDVADSRHLANRVEARGGRGAGVERARRLSAPVASLLRDEGEVAGQGAARALGSQRAAARASPSASFAWTEARAHRARRPTARFAPEMAAIAKEFFDKRWIDAPVREGKAPGAFSAADRALGAPVCAA